MREIDSITARPCFTPPRPKAEIRSSTHACVRRSRWSSLHEGTWCSSVTIGSLETLSTALLCETLRHHVCQPSACPRRVQDASTSSVSTHGPQVRFGYRLERTLWSAR